MIKLRNLIFNGIPRVAVAFTDAAQPEQILQAAKSGVDVAELRIDQYKSYEKNHVLDQVKKFGSLPTIATIRSKAEGGAWTLPDNQRADLFLHVLPHVDAIDIELSSAAIAPDLIKAAHKAGKLVVVSYHNFSQTPDSDALAKIASDAKKIGADIVKIAAHVKEHADLQRLARFTIENKDKNVIVIGMGSEGTASRVLLPALGSLLIYAFMGQSMAPGQLEYSATFDLLSALYPEYAKEKINSIRYWKSS